MLKHIACAIACVVLLGGCQDTGQETSRAFVGVDAVMVTLAENASYGLLQDQQDPALAQAFVATLRAELQQDIISGGSGNKAEILVERLTIQGGAGRTVAAVESYVYGNVVVKNASGAVVARIDGVDFTNRAARNNSTINGIPIGALISMAQNAKDAKPEQQVATLADGYSKKIAANLGR